MDASGGQSNLNQDQLGGYLKGDVPTHFAPKAAISAYHTEHPIDVALGKYRIAQNVAHSLKGESPSAGDILQGTTAIQESVGGSNG